MVNFRMQESESENIIYCQSLLVGIESREQGILSEALGKGKPNNAHFSGRVQ